MQQRWNVGCSTDNRCYVELIDDVPPTSALVRGTCEEPSRLDGARHEVCVREVGIERLDQELLVPALRRA